MNVFRPDESAPASHDAGRRVGRRRAVPSFQRGLMLALSFKVTGSPAVLSQAVRGRNRD